jgi:23S rRNA (guanosine2251-2'-O)-methyltransferase
MVKIPLPTGTYKTNLCFKMTTFPQKLFTKPAHSHGAEIKFSLNNIPMITLHNPHSVLAALEHRPKDIQKITVSSSLKEEGNDAWSKVVTLAKKLNIPVELGNSGGRKDSAGRVSVSSALIKPKSSVSIEELFEGAKDRKDGHGLWLALDQLQDPQNLGAIFRTAAFFGVQGIVMTEERSAPITGAAYDVATGGIETVPFTIQTNLQRAFEKAKDVGLWILGSSEHAHDSLSSVTRDRPWLLVLGNEEKGMRRLTEDSCDVLCKIPSQGKVTSLNVSVAAGILVAALS